MQKASNPKYPGNPEHNEKTKPKDYIDMEESEDFQLKGPVNIFNKIIEENFPNLKKEMNMSIQEAYRTQINWTRNKIPPFTYKSKYQMH